jgi:hypothetical protein
MKPLECALTLGPRHAVPLQRMLVELVFAESASDPGRILEKSELSPLDPP